MTSSTQPQVVLLEDPSKTYDTKLKEILLTAEDVVKKFVGIRWGEPGWKQLMISFQKEGRFDNIKKKFKSKNTNPSIIDSYDLTNLCFLLHNAKNSPVYVKRAGYVYEKTWVNPQEDLADKFLELETFFRNHAVTQCAKNNVQNISNIFKEAIVSMASNMNLAEEEIECYVSSYIWLKNQTCFPDALLLAPQAKGGIDGMLSVIKLVNNRFDCCEYAFVVYLSILREKRNLIHDRKPFIFTVSYIEDFNIIQQCINGILYLTERSIVDKKMDEVTLKDFQEYRQGVGKKIENISAHCQFETDEASVLQFRQTFQEACDTIQNVRLDENKMPENNNMVRPISKDFMVDQSTKTVYDSVETVACQIKNEKKEVNEELGPRSDRDRQLLALDKCLVDFMISFDPFESNAIYILQLRGIFSSTDIERISVKICQKEKVSEFLHILKFKHNWFNILKQVLAELNFSNLVQKLEAAYEG